MTTIHTLASGSSGNALLIRGHSFCFLVDAGISCRRICSALSAFSLLPTDLDAIFVTHCHSDHISGMQTLLKRTSCPIYASPRTCRELEYRLAGIAPRLQPLPLCTPLSVCGCAVTAAPTSHDAPGSCAFRFDTPHGSIGIVTDTGVITPEVQELLPGVELAFLEANHDIDRLRSGPYPFYLKQRILGSQGHLCNEDAAGFAVTLAQNGADEIVLSHLSSENNTPELAYASVSAALVQAGLSPVLSVAPRNDSAQFHFRRPSCSE